MNANQLIALLEIYRSGVKLDYTTTQDLDELKSLKLIEPDPGARNQYQTTESGDTKIRAILALMT